MHPTILKKSKQTWNLKKKVKNLIGPFFSRAPPLCQVSCQAAGQCLPNPAFTQTNKPTNGNENITSAKESFSQTIWSLLQEISVCMQYTFCPDISPQHDRADTYIYIYKL